MMIGNIEETLHLDSSKIMKKHQINIITAQPNENGWRAKTKTFKLGYETTTTTINGGNRTS